MTRTIAISSGKGGVGKTNIGVNLALQMARLGYRTCLFDADLGLANTNILLRLNPEKNLEDVIDRTCTLDDIILRDYHGIDIIPGSSGIEKMVNLDENAVNRLIQAFVSLKDYDFLFFDTSAGVSRDVLAFCLTSEELLLVITPEPTSLTDAYALLKILTMNDFSGHARVVVNNCRDIPSAKNAYTTFKQTVQNYLQVDIAPLGIILQDPRVTEAVKSQQALLTLFPECNASKCIRLLAKNLLERCPTNPSPDGLSLFWKRCFQLLCSPVKGTACEGERSGDGMKEQHVEEEKRPAPQEGARTFEQGVAAQGFMPLLNLLLETNASLSEELRGIRKAIETRGWHQAPDRNPDFPENRRKVAPSIPLDFDRFMKTHEKELGREENE